jgi:hypothetical protein
MKSNLERTTPLWYYSVSSESAGHFRKTMRGV